MRLRICNLLSHDIRRNELEGRSNGTRSMCDVERSLMLWSSSAAIVNKRQTLLARKSGATKAMTAVFAMALLTIVLET